MSVGPRSNLAAAGRLTADSRRRYKRKQQFSSLCHDSLLRETLRTQHRLLSFNHPSPSTSNDRSIIYWEPTPCVPTPCPKHTTSVTHDASTAFKIFHSTPHRTNSIPNVLYFFTAVSLVPLSIPSTARTPGSTFTKVCAYRRNGSFTPCQIPTAAYPHDGHEGTRAERKGRNRIELKRTCVANGDRSARCIFSANSHTIAAQRGKTGRRHNADKAMRR